VPVVSYTVSDGAGGTDTSTLTLSVTPANDAPVAITDAGSTDENTMLTVSTGGGVLVNDSDIDGNTLTVSAVNGVLADVGRPVAGTGGGTFTMAAEGSYDFDPGTAFDDLAPGAWRTSSIAYTISDGNGGTATATLTVTVIGRNDPVAAADDGATTDEVTSVVTGSLAGLLVNDLDVDGDPLAVSAVGGSPSGVGSLVAGSSGGTFAIAADGSYVFTPGGDFDDLAPGQSRTTSVVYTVRDAAGAEATATLTITVMGTNDAPELGPIVAPPALDGAAVNFDVSGFASDPDDGSLTFAAAGLPPGLAMDAATGRITGVLPHDASLASPYSVTVTVTDGQGGSATRTFSWPVGNPAPVAGDDTAGTREDVPVRIQVLANDYDPDGDTLTVAAATAERGTVTIHTDGTLGYVPAPAFSGVDLITYTISDGNGGTATATIRVSVEARTLVLLDEVFGFDGDTPATDIEFSGGTEADGAVLDAVREAGDLSSIAGTLDADGAVLAAANGVRSLGGIGSFGELDPDVVADMLSSLRHAELDQLSIGGRSGDPREAEGHGGFSLKAAFDGQRQGGSIQGALVVESLVRDRTLMLQLSSTASLGGKSIVEYRVTRTDGSPVPPWLGRAGPDLLIGERPADLETIELRIEGICSDGSRVVQDVHIDVTTGEIKPLKPLQHGEAAPLLFRDQLYADRELSPDEIERLAEAIMAFRAA